MCIEGNASEKGQLPLEIKEKASPGGKKKKPSRLFGKDRKRRRGSAMKGTNLAKEKLVKQ